MPVHTIVSSFTATAITNTWHLGCIHISSYAMFCHHRSKIMVNISDMSCIKSYVCYSDNNKSSNYTKTLTLPKDQWSIGVPYHWNVLKMEKPFRFLTFKKLRNCYMFYRYFFDNYLIKNSLIHIFVIYSLWIFRFGVFVLGICSWLKFDSMWAIL